MTSTRNYLVIRLKHILFNNSSQKSFSFSEPGTEDKLTLTIDNLIISDNITMSFYFDKDVLGYSVVEEGEDKTILSNVGTVLANTIQTISFDNDLRNSYILHIDLVVRDLRWEEMDIQWNAVIGSWPEQVT